MLSRHQALRLTALLWASLIVLALPATAAETGHPMPAIAFPQEHSELKADPAQVYGRLPNGMTYVIQKNQTPVRSATILFRVDLGSMMETEKQKGLAHFVEHMAFQGTTHIPRGELKAILERNGFTFGVDANAFTTASKTTYALTAPNTEKATIDTALFIIREIAGNITLDPAAIETERGVVLAEERVRDNPVMHRDTALGQFLYPGLRMADYSNPIGSTDIVKSAPAAEIAGLYHTWYRPDLATIVIVGDIDPKDIEARLKATFGDWKATAAAPAEPYWGHYAATGPRAFTYEAKGIAREIDATWVRPVEDRPDSPVRRMERGQDGLLALLLNRRYQQALQTGKASYVSASLGFYDNFKTSRNIFLAVTPSPGKAKEAFNEAYAVLRTFTSQGVTSDEAALIQSILPSFRTNLEKSYATRDNGGIAYATLDAIDTDSVVSGLDDSLKEIDGMAPALTQEALNARLKALFTGDGPIFADYGESTQDFPQASVMADYAVLASGQATAYAGPVRKPWPYANFGPRQQPVSHMIDPDFAFGHYVFPNGVILNVKHTDFAANQVLVEVDFAGGSQRLDPRTPRPVTLPFGSFVLAGGLGKLELGDIQATLAGKVASVSYGMAGRRSLLTGGTTPADLPTQMQLLMAYTVDPGLRSQPYAQFQAYVPEALRTMKSNPGAVLGHEISSVIHPGDWRFDQHWLEKAPSVPWSDLAKIYTDSLKNTPITITIVGDIDDAGAVAAVASTFATLPTRPKIAEKAAGGDVIRFPPAEHAFTFLHDGRQDQNISVVLWPTTDFYANPQQARGMHLLAGVLRNRLFDDLRQKAGADYSPESFSNMDAEYPGFGYFQIDATIKLADDALFRDTVAKIVADLQSRPVSADELERVRRPLLDSFATEQKTNGYWFSTIIDVGTTPGARAATLNFESQLQAVTPAELMQLAKTYLRADTAIHIAVKPRPAP